MDQELYKMLKERHAAYREEMKEVYSQATKLLDEIEQQLNGLFENEVKSSDIMCSLTLVEESIEAFKEAKEWFESVNHDMSRLNSLEEFKERLGVNYKG